MITVSLHVADVSHHASYVQARDQLGNVIRTLHVDASVFARKSQYFPLVALRKFQSTANTIKQSAEEMHTYTD